MHVAVIGAGKMGLPLACQLARNGASVTACDINPDLVDQINQGIAPFDEPALPELLATMVQQGRLRATTDTIAAAASSHVIIVIVPVLVTADHQADLSIINQVTEQIAPQLQPGTMVIYETTLPVGTTRRLAARIQDLIPLPWVQRGEGSLHRSSDQPAIDVVFSPERVKSQLVFQRLTENPKVVGGLTPAATARAADFYQTYLGAPIIPMDSPEAAEMVKLAGMIYRDVNIALANELARYAEAVGIDFASVARAANTNGEAALLQPGIGVGGHCTPVYPYFLLQDSQQRGIPMRLTEQSRQINDSQAAYALQRLERLWRPLAGCRVLILGLGFRPQVKEHICSPAFLIQAALHARGAYVQLHDPLYQDDELRQLGFEPGSLSQQPAPHVLVLNTAHDSFTQLDFAALAAQGVQAVLDGRQTWQAEAVRAAGLFYVGIGQPDQALTPGPSPKEGESRPVPRPHSRHADPLWTQGRR
ncbi:MAG: nucleotide sugar dehydrogenase [Chloroflexaceae bacterium]|nr:nucleotide sugar dehydrogenase [Chloroflexaceae bacterium]